jgi:glycosyltransferase involved in cell wall biosynthesis
MSLISASAMSVSHPCRVIHIVENLNQGAVENWLVRMLCHAHHRGEDCDWTFYCVLGQPGALDELVRSVGGKIVYSPVSLDSRQIFFRALRTELRHGNYEVMHCHHDLMNAAYLLASIGLPIRKRIVHIHNADENLPTPSLLKQRLLREPMRRICLRADRVVGISQHTLDTFLAGRQRRSSRDLVHYYGVDPTPFVLTNPDRRRFRQDLGLAPDALILLFGGRITPEKNPVMVVDILAALLRIEPRAVAVFAGAGSLEGEVRKRAHLLGIEHQLRTIGWRNDLPDVMACCDWFILPRPEQPMEGFGLAVVEAQLAGLRLLLSTGIPDDPLLSTACYRRLSLAQGADEWARAAIELLNEPHPTATSAISALKNSPIEMDYALQDLIKLHL